MVFKTQIRASAERNQARTAQRVDKYYSTVSFLLAKLPGERVTKYAVRALEAQQEATHRSLHRQAKLQDWWLRDRGHTGRPVSGRVCGRQAGEA